MGSHDLPLPHKAVSHLTPWSHTDAQKASGMCSYNSPRMSHAPRIGRCLQRTEARLQGEHCRGRYCDDIHRFCACDLRHLQAGTSPADTKPTINLMRCPLFSPWCNPHPVCFPVPKIKGGKPQKHAALGPPAGSRTGQGRSSPKSPRGGSHQSPATQECAALEEPIVRR